MKASSRWPDRRYRCQPPFFVVYSWSGHEETWNVDELLEALRCFWQDGHLSPPARRTLSDANGTVIAEEIVRQHPSNKFFITAEAYQTMHDHMVAGVGVETANNIRQLVDQLLAEGKERVDGTRW